jgi:hypothetical protein
MVTRVREARERMGLDLSALDARLGRPGWAYDFDSYPGDLESAASLREVQALADALGVTPAYLVAADGDPPSIMSFGSLREALISHLSGAGASLAEFENLAGWSLDGFLDDPTMAWEWHADQLRDTCTALGVDWRTVLAWLPSGGA